MSTNISGDKMFSYLHRIDGDHRPITADVFLTNYCNNRCPYCTYARWEMDNGAYAMKYEDFVRYAERMLWLGVQGIILSGGGEPTLCPDFKAITGWMEEHYVHYGINTNFNNLVYFKPDYLKVSLDGWDENSYERSRGVRKYGQVIENIKAYAEWKKDNSPDTTLGVQKVCTSADDVYRFYDANKSLDVDYFSFRPMESTDGKYYMPAEQKGLIRETTDAIKHLAGMDKRVVLNFKWDLLGHRMPYCIAQWAQIAVNERGEVMYCCHKPYQIIGHIMDEDILEKKAAAETDMSMCDVPCRMTAPNEFVRQAEMERKDKYFI